MTVIPSTGVNWGFSASDIFSNSQSVVGSVAGFLVLGIVIAFTPRMFTVIRSAVTGRGGRK